MSDVTVVVLTKNEEKNIGRLYNEVAHLRK